MTLVDFKRIKGEMRIAFIMAVIVIVVAQKCSNRKIKNAMRLQIITIVTGIRNLTIFDPLSLPIIFLQ